VEIIIDGRAIIPLGEIMGFSNSHALICFTIGTFGLFQIAIPARLAKF
jgi:hypothetical protein